ncbi:MAG TPA: hypothetical protein VFD36_25165 [Kofleriaceae bacterium]|nr:hypothetical protein [Kofleriaceae bacterium]
MIGQRVGVRTGVYVGVAPGINQDEIWDAPGAGDGPGQSISVPMTGAAFLALTGRSATHAYTCQEASGDLIDQIGAMNMVAIGGPLYSVTVAGWTRKGVGFNRTNSQGFSVGAGVGPNPTATPVAMLIYYTTRATVGQNELLMISDGGPNAWAMAMDNGSLGGTLSTFCGAAINTGVASHQDGAVHPLLLTYDPAGTINRYTDLERDDGTFAAGVVDGVKGLGADGTQASHLGEVLAYWIMQGANAQFTALQAKTFLQSFGWAPPWAAP